MAAPGVFLSRGSSHRRRQGIVKQGIVKRAAPASLNRRVRLQLHQAPRLDPAMPPSRPYSTARTEPAMPLSRDQIEEWLQSLETRVSAMLRDRNAFPRLFEDQVELLLGRVAANDRAYALAQLEAIVERSGFNRQA
jgi:hypothetical protein